VVASGGIWRVREGELVAHDVLASARAATAQQASHAALAAFDHS
jgi:hypothetical protein